MHRTHRHDTSARNKETAIHCFDCDQTCCRTVVIEVDAPRSLRDYSDLVFYLHHGGTEVVVAESGRKREWYIQYHSPCRNLSKDGRCRIYVKRPLVCREYDWQHCERNTSSAMHYIRSTEEFYEFLKKIGKTRILEKLVATHRHDAEAGRETSASAAEKKRKSARGKRV